MCLMSPSNLSWTVYAVIDGFNNRLKGKEWPFKNKVSELTGNISIYCKEELKISKEDY